MTIEIKEKLTGSDFDIGGGGEAVIDRFTKTESPQSITARKN